MGRCVLLLFYVVVVDVFSLPVWRGNSPVPHSYRRAAPYLEKKVDVITEIMNISLHFKLSDFVLVFSLGWIYIDTSCVTLLTDTVFQLKTKCHVHTYFMCVVLTDLYLDCR